MAAGENIGAHSVSDGRAVARLAIRMRKIIADRLSRDLLSTPAWDMLLDLYVREERRPMSLTSLCGAADIPARTALNTINRLVAHQLLTRRPDDRDGRRVNVELSDRAIALLDETFADVAGLFRDE